MPSPSGIFPVPSPSGRFPVPSPCSSDTGRGLKRSSSKTRSDDSDVFLQQLKEFDNRIINSIEEKIKLYKFVKRHPFATASFLYYRDF